MRNISVFLTLLALERYDIMGLLHLGRNLSMKRRFPPRSAMLKRRTVLKLQNSIMKELAAAASVPVYPMVTEYMENPVSGDAVAQSGHF